MTQDVLQDLLETLEDILSAPDLRDCDKDDSVQVWLTIAEMRALVQLLRRQSHETEP